MTHLDPEAQKDLFAAVVLGIILLAAAVTVLTKLHLAVRHARGRKDPRFKPPRKNHTILRQPPSWICAACGTEFRMRNTDEMPGMCPACGTANHARKPVDCDPWSVCECPHCGQEIEILPGEPYRGTYRPRKAPAFCPRCGRAIPDKK